MRSFLIFRNRVPIGTIEGTTIHDAQAKAWLLWDAGIRVWDDSDASEGVIPYLALAAKKRQYCADVEERWAEEDLMDDRYIQRLYNGFIQAGWDPNEWKKDEEGDQPT